MRDRTRLLLLGLAIQLWSLRWVEGVGTSPSADTQSISAYRGGAVYGRWTGVELPGFRGSGTKLMT